ncbi:hypothetical protein EVAR_95743_1 [Eumeta japonica]|uniref:Uncharacterized protein n=1 Tax=Eumeta variegata TaxID=151549 RepID=A0A4C1ULI3_EUMVA|nr:hypothetical protein EVAR_95743_1 [Eumeta japonica]
MFCLQIARSDVEDSGALDAEIDDQLTRARFLKRASLESGSPILSRFRKSLTTLRSSRRVNKVVYRPSSLLINRADESYSERRFVERRALIKRLVLSRRRGRKQTGTQTGRGPARAHPAAPQHRRHTPPSHNTARTTAVKLLDTLRVCSSVKIVYPVSASLTNNVVSHAVTALIIPVIRLQVISLRSLFVFLPNRPTRTSNSSGLRVPVGGDDHLASDGSQARSRHETIKKSLMTEAN